jgi:hypothetical protein
MILNCSCPFVNKFESFQCQGGPQFNDTRAKATTTMEFPPPSPSNDLQNRILAKQKELSRLRQAIITRLQELQAEEAQLLAQYHERGGDTESHARRHHSLYK